jgi:hypothetical protein
LIIDQMNNPGGNLLYLYALASLLSDQPLDIPKHRIALTQEDLYFAFNESPEIAAVCTDLEAKELLGETLQGIPVSRKLAEGVFLHLQFIIDEWNSGRELTDPTYLLGIGPLEPYPSACYTKPIPAGAGGYLKKVEFPNLNGIAYFTYTVSLAERIDGQPLENLGVVPDINYEITENDLVSRYQEFSQAVLEVVDQITPIKKERKKRWKSRLSKR